MNSRFVRVALFVALFALVPFQSPAPLIYTPGEGWTYEPVGETGDWRRDRAKDQLIVAQDAFDRNDIRTAHRAATRVVRVWPMSDYAPQAQYLIGRCLEARNLDEQAFKAYNKLLRNYPRSVNYEEVLQRQYEIANQFLDGQRFRLWGRFIPLFPSMEKTAALFGSIITNGPYSTVAPDAQLKIGEAREKQSNYPAAVKAYETATDRYSDQIRVASDALFRKGLAYEKQAAKAEYDQSTAGLAIATFEDFITLYPEDPRVAQARSIINALKAEQARGNFDTAEYYEKRHNWRAARVYYNEVVNLLLDEPNSPRALEARARLEALNQRLQTTAANP